jgi:hypothetical protein
LIAAAVSAAAIFSSQWKKGCEFESEAAQGFQMFDRSHRIPSDAAAQAQISGRRAVRT